MYDRNIFKNTVCTKEILMSEKLIRTLVRQILTEGIYDPGILKAVFMAGGPGSGKSFTAKAIFGGNQDAIYSAMTESGLKLLNSDPAFEHFLKEAGVDLADLGRITEEEPELAYQLGLDDDRGIPPDSPRGKAKKIKKTAQKMWTRPDARLGVIIDGTGDDYNSLERKKLALEQIGYDTYMIFVNTTLEVAQERNQKRDRKLSKKLVEKIWTDVQANLGAFQSLFGMRNMVIVDNTVYGPVPAELEEAVQDFVNAPIQNPVGREWVEAQLEKRGEEDIARKAPGTRGRLLGDEESDQDDGTP